LHFFDEYSRFYETTGTRLKPNRFRQRHKAIIQSNVHLLQDARVLDLASDDGRWAFAALKAGAKCVLGVEARAELVRRGRETFAHYGVAPETGRLLVDDVEHYLASPNREPFDVILCLGFFYHTMHHMRLLELMRGTGAHTFIIDTVVAPSSLPVISMYTEPVDDVRSAVDHAGTGAGQIPVGVPSRQAMKLMLAYLGFNLSELPWRPFCDDWAECEDYEAGHRGTFVAQRVAG
jgi:hypothetical protein